MKPNRITTINGMNDILPDQSHIWSYIENAYKETMYRYGFLEIKTPILEKTELFQKGTGENTDIVTKEMYSFKDKGEEDITVRPEGTPSVVRSYIEHNLGYGNSTVKLFYFGPMFRRERPQRGRLRQFYQYGCEAFGDKSPYMDAEIIKLLHNFYNSLKLDVLFKVNSIGCNECRSKFKERLISHLSNHIESLCEDCRQRINKNPLRIIDCKKDENNTFIKNSPKITDYICEDCKNHFNIFQNLISDIPHEINPNIVRGLDYYNKTVFEAYAVGEDGRQDSLSGGGRYDDLVEILGGSKTPATGFAGGVERLIMRLNHSSFIQISPDLFVSYLGDVKNWTYNWINNLRFLNENNNGLRIDIDWTDLSLKSQMKKANKINAKYSIVIGENEINSGIGQFKRMSDGKTETLKLNDFEHIFDLIKNK